MSEFNITVEGGTSVRLPTAGKYCDRDIVITATGGGGGTYWENFNINRVDEYALYGCDLLHTVVISRVGSVNTYAFARCKNLTEIRLGSLPNIGEYAFYMCENLKTFTSDTGIANVRAHAFDGCVSLENVDLRNTASIGVAAFKNCKSLSYVYNISAYSVRSDAFVGCESLTKADFELVTTIESSAFYGCASLSSLILRTTDTVCSVDVSALYETPMVTGQGHIYVPASMYEYYRVGYETALNQMMPGFFDILFRKIEDYPEITGDDGVAVR